MGPGGGQEDEQIVGDIGDVLKEPEDNTRREMAAGRTRARPAKKLARHRTKKLFGFAAIFSAIQFVQVKAPRQFLYQPVFFPLHGPPRAGLGVIVSFQVQNAMRQITDDLRLPGGAKAARLSHGVIHRNKNLAMQISIVPPLS